MAGYTYASYQAAVITQIPSLLTDPNFLTMLPNSIDYAELSCYRDVDFLVVQGTESIVANRGTVGFALPSEMVVLESLSWQIVAVPPGQDTPIVPVSRDFLMTCYGYGASQGSPQVYATVGAFTNSGSAVPVQNIIIGPPPDRQYTLTAYGTIRPLPLSSTKTTTWLSVNLPDLFWAAAMIYWSGYKQNFGSMADDPKMAVSWEAEYQRILKGATVEEARRKFQSQGWQAQSPTPIANPRT